MATEAQLRQRMHELEAEIEALRRQNEENRRQLTRQLQQRTADLQEEYKKALKRQQRETEEKYAERIRTFRDQLMANTQQQIHDLEKKSEQVAAQQKVKLDELSGCNEELRRLLKKSKEHAEAVQKLHSEVAQARLNEIPQHRQATEATPHTFFCAGEFDIIESHARQIQDEIAQEMYQAAAADASSVIMEFDLLRIKVEQALHEWMLAFTDYVQSVESIWSSIQLLESNPVQTAAGSFTMPLEELDFWSSGTYLTYRKKVEAAHDTIQEIQHDGPTAYLSRQDGTQRRAIFTQVKEAHRWDDELTGIMNCILSERALSDERYAVARRAAAGLRMQGYHIVKRRFRQADENLCSKDWYPKGLQKSKENPLDCFDLEGTINDSDFLHIMWVPVRKNGVAVRNECIIYLTASALQDAALVNDVVQANLNRLRNTVPEIKAYGIAADATKQGRAAAEEQQRKQNPDPAKQIRYLEKKYH